MITILTDGSLNNLGETMFNLLIKDQNDVKQFYLDKMEIKPCYSCRGCEEKTYKRCIVRDDADTILPHVARSSTIIVLTPITFGSYSFQTKRVIDKFALIGDLHYYYKNGELVKSMNSTETKYFVIGTYENKDDNEITAFKNLVNENLWITGWSGKSIVTPLNNPDFNELIREIV